MPNSLYWNTEGRSEIATLQESFYTRGQFRTPLSFVFFPYTEVYDVWNSLSFPEESKNLFSSSIDLLESNEINYLMINGPYNYEKRICSELDDLISSKISEANYLDLNGNITLTPNNLYSHEYHLNIQGGLIYTQMICDKIEANLWI